MTESKKIFITGGAGYAGAVLVPKLLAAGYEVKIVDLYLFGDNVFEGAQGNPNLVEVKGDIRNKELMERELAGYDTVIHLACISNDPSFELNPELGKSINYDAFLILLEAARKHGVKKFIYASSSSVYGVKSEPNVTEDLELTPLTDYSKYKAACERVLREDAPEGMVHTVIRPATLCGYSPRQRLDLTVNILTNHAVNKGKITVFGGEQKRPNLHVEDMAELYVFLLTQPDEKIHGQIFNVGYENHTVREIAEMVQRVIDPSIPIEVTPTDDNRSYHVSAEKIKRMLGFEARRTIEDAVSDLKRAFEDGRLPDSLTDKRYFNIKTMQAINLS